MSPAEVAPSLCQHCERQPAGTDAPACAMRVIACAAFAGSYVPRDDCPPWWKARSLPPRRTRPPPSAAVSRLNSLVPPRSSRCPSHPCPAR